MTSKLSHLQSVPLYTPEAFVEAILLEFEQPEGQP